MEKKKEEIQICRPNDLSDEIRNELASAQDHVCLKDDRIYLQIDQSVFCFPNSPASKELVFTINNKYGSKCQKPCSYKEVLEKIAGGVGIRVHTTCQDNKSSGLSWGCINY